MKKLVTIAIISLGLFSCVSTKKSWTNAGEAAKAAYLQGYKEGTLHMLDALQKHMDPDDYREMVINDILGYDQYIDRLVRQRKKP
jgi:hypothetical protein